MKQYNILGGIDNINRKKENEKLQRIRKRSN